MSNKWVSEKLPIFEQQVRRLTEQHGALKDEPLQLALCYGPVREPDDIFLLEVVGSDHEDTVDPDRTLFEVVYAPTPGFPMDLDRRLHLTLTSPEEFQTALRERWSSVEEIVRAIEDGSFRVFYANKTGKKLLKCIQGPSHPIKVP